MTTRGQFRMALAHLQRVCIDHGFSFIGIIDVMDDDELPIRAVYCTHRYEDMDPDVLDLIEHIDSNYPDPDDWDIIE